MSNHLWLGCGDIHEDFGKVLSLPELNQADGILIAGDLTNRPCVEKTRGFLLTLKERCPNVWAQIGNMDSFEIEEVLDELGINVHLQVVELIPDLCLAGVGYSTPTPFNTPSEVSEKAMAKWLQELKPKLKDKKHVIFMTHTPPVNTKCDIVLSGAHVGSQAVREFVEEVQPDICLTGHIHESKGIDEIGQTLVVNPGPVGQGGYVKIWYRDQRLEVELN